MISASIRACSWSRVRFCASTKACCMPALTKKVHHKVWYENMSWDVLGWLIKSVSCECCMPAVARCSCISTSIRWDCISARRRVSSACSCCTSDWVAGQVARAREMNGGEG